MGPAEKISWNLIDSQLSLPQGLFIYFIKNAPQQLKGRLTVFVQKF